MNKPFTLPAAHEHDDYQPERRNRSWAMTIAEQRERLDQSLSRNPSLKSDLDGPFAAYRQAKPAASRETDCR